MRNRIFTSTVAVLALFAVVGLVSALAPSIAWPNLARAHSPGSASLTALTVTAGGAAQALTPTFSSTVYSYTVRVANSVAQVTVTGTPDGDGNVTADQQVDIPTEGYTSIDVVVTHVDSMTTTTQTYTVQVFRVIREGTVESDRAALIALYNSTAGTSWMDRTNWDSMQPLGTWHGVTTDIDGRVTAVALGANTLAGPLPDELGNLPSLQNLSLYTNQLTGTIPAELGNLTSLTTLSLYTNQLSGPIPGLNRLTNLEFLDLHGNQLSGNIPSVSGLTNLTDMRLHENLLSGPIPDLSSLTSLTHLYLNKNELSGTIPDLSDLTSLTTLSLFGNQLSGTIPNLSRLTSLQELHLHSNQLSGRIPTSLSNLTNLTRLDLSSNNFDGPIPALSRLTRLVYLSLKDNQLSGPIPALNALTGLTHLDLHSNQLSGSIPTLTSLTSLRHLDLSSNELSGGILNLNGLTSLEYLSLWDNQLTGSIPTTLNSRTTLLEVRLNSNLLTDAIPDVSALTRLTTLDLSNNRLTGAIPDVSALAMLTTLDLSNNRLSGAIPATLNSRTGLTHLALNHNQLTGAIPAGLGLFTELQKLSLRNNQLTGTIPAELGNLTNLKVTRFASNPSLTGCVPLGLRYLIAAEDYQVPELDPYRPFLDIPAQDFLAEDTNRDGDTDDPDDIPGLNLPFCMLSTLAFSGVTLTPAFAVDTATYTASVANTVESTTVTATLAADANSSDRLSIGKGTASYRSGAAVPLSVGQNKITVTVTPTDGTPTLTYTVTVLREGVGVGVGVDRDTLMELYNSTGGANWTNKTHWGSTEHLNDWYGVITNADGTVNALELPGNNLSRTLPASLGSLTSLDSLDLSNNRLSGPIPDLSAITRLATLILSGNQLSGPIPDLSAGTSLGTLNLSDNQLRGTIPAWLGRHTDLQILSLRGNRLTGTIPEAVGNLPRIFVTRFAGNTLTGCVPDRLRGLLDGGPYLDLPVQDFIPDDANGDGDTDDVGDTPGLGLPFCTLRSLTLSDVTLEPAFASSVTDYTATVVQTATATTVTVSWYRAGDTVSIMKGADTYPNRYDLVPLDVGQNVITISVTTSDGTPSPHIYTVTVTRAPNTPPTFNEGSSTARGVVENTASDKDIGNPVAATDDDNDTLTYSLDATSAASFDIDASSGQLKTKAVLDYETKSSYTVTVSVRDSKDNNSAADEATDDTISVTILVANVNEAPEFPTIVTETGTRNVDENTPPGVNIGEPVTATDDDRDPLTYSLGGRDRASFDIVSTTGQLKTEAALDYERDEIYYVTVTAADPSGARDSIDVIIDVNNLDEAGTVTLSSTQPIVGRSLTAGLDEPDNVSGSATWSWARSPNGASSWTPISGATSDSYTPVTADVTRFLRATASYSDALGSGRSAQEVSANSVLPAPTGINERPQFPTTETRERDVDENTSPGVSIGAPVAATDADDDTLTYSLDSNDRVVFDIVSTTGQLRTKAALDHETTDSYSVTVTVRDTADERNNITVSINVNNLDEPATVTLSSLQPLVAFKFTATLDEPDDVSGSVTWLWERSPDGASDWTTISGATTAAYTPVAGDVGDYLRATASYTDREGPDKSAQASSANAVEVAPGRNAPVLREYPTARRSLPRNTPAGRNFGRPISATDADNQILTYSLGGPDRASFDIVSATGQLRTNALLTGIRRTGYIVFVSVSDGKNDVGNQEGTPQIDATTRVTINVGGSGSSFVRGSGSSGGSGGSSGGGSGSGGGGGSRATPTPTPTPSPTPTATPTPTGPQFSGLIAAEPSVTATVVPDEGTTLGLNGGGDLPGGVYVNFPPTAVVLPVHVSISVSDEAPSDVAAPSGTTLLPLTINITTEPPLILGEPLTIEINPTPEQLAAAGGDLKNLSVGVVTPNGIVVLPAQVMHGRLVVTTDRLAPFILLAVTDTGPTLTQPPMGDASSMGPLLQWTQPPQTTWFQVQVIPFNEDGPGINLVIGDRALVRGAQYQVLGPNFGSADPNYVMLPGMTYLWRVRTTTVTTNPTEADWSAWAVSSFKTPPASSSTITPVAPPAFGEVSTLTPTLTWANSNTAVFYYEVQVSKDYEFGPNAFLYSEYVHGGASTPPNSYVIPEAFPLEAGEIYYWRVRPRIQGDGDPLPWSITYVFLAPG